MAKILDIRSTCEDGFTLAELVAIILLVGILAFTVVPRYLNKSVINTSIMAEQLANDIRYTQSLAMTSGQGNRINLTATTYQITTSSGGPLVHPVTGSAGPITLNNVMLSVSPALANGYVGFDSKGIPYTDMSAGTALAATTTITLTAGSNTRTVVISPQTGRVLVP